MHLTFNIKSPNYKKVERAVLKILKENSIIDPPIRLSEIIDNCRLGLKITNFGDKYRRNVSGFLDTNQNIIYVNHHEPIERQRFTIAHELGHWVLHHEIIEKDPSQYEVLMRRPLAKEDLDYLDKEANCFASNLLVPKHLLNDYKKYATHSELATLFMVSEEMVRYSILRRYSR